MQEGDYPLAEPPENAPDDSDESAAIRTSEMSRFASIRAFIRRQRVILLVIPCLALLAGLIVALVIPPVYQATATVRITLKPSTLAEEHGGGTSFSTSTEVSRYLQTTADVIRSQYMALQVVDSLNLQKNETLLGFDLMTDSPSGENTESWTASLRREAAQVLMANITVLVPADSQIISIQYKSDDPVLAANVANSYVENLIRDSALQNVEASATARNYLEGQIADVRNKLQDADIRATDYARSNHIVGNSTSDTSGSLPPLTISSLVDINQAYSMARAERIAAEQRWLTVAEIPPEQVMEVKQSSTMQSLRTQQVLLNSELAGLLQRYRDDYPEVIELRRKLDSLNQGIDQTAMELKQGIRSAFDSKRGQEHAMARELARVSDQALDDQSRRAQYNLIDQDVNAYRSQLETLLKSYDQITIAANVQNNPIAKLDAAIVPNTAISPNFVKYMFFALIFGLGLAIAIAITRDVVGRPRSLE